MFWINFLLGITNALPLSILDGAQFLKDTIVIAGRHRMLGGIQEAEGRWQRHQCPRRSGAIPAPLGDHSTAHNIGLEKGLKQEMPLTREPVRSISQG
ncbi:hypothetical protein [Thermogymnomonas acidicola]|uniref:site-2 protease family protein n=1 Tax=Thermogymnomonas acidicola TaxID=399579 RepID=UPI00094624CB|nr:site-2 protease family protein [Thermogymnomonas acidicola]